MKKYLCFVFILSFFLFSCGNSNEGKRFRPSFNKETTYVKSVFGSEYWDKPIDSLGSCYAVVLKDKQYYGIDIVLSSEDINNATSIIHNYLFLHVDSLVMQGDYSSVKLIYYTNRVITQDLHQMYDSYYTNISNEDVKIDSTSEYISVSYKGIVQNTLNPSDKRLAIINANKIPIRYSK
ncbi:MAG: hypothetical protein IJ180_04910 [Bacteroidales bacterium]|nr:hypothetical protein [Bacteroidales bacterium]